MDKKQQVARLLNSCAGGKLHSMWALSGSQNAAARAQILSLVTDTKVPQHRAGINALRNACYQLFEITGTCDADREDTFTELIINMRGI